MTLNQGRHLRIWQALLSTPLGIQWARRAPQYCLRLCNILVHDCKIGSHIRQLGVCKQCCKHAHLVCQSCKPGMAMFADWACRSGNHGKHTLQTWFARGAHASGTIRKNGLHVAHKCWHPMHKCLANHTQLCDNIAKIHTFANCTMRICWCCD